MYLPPHPDPSTCAFYDGRAAELAGRYDAFPMTVFWDIMLGALPRGGRILEMGCGSGRDAGFLFRNGFRVFGLDGSLPMLGEASRLHPSLGGRFLRAVLPGPLPFREASFDGVTMIAALMHLPPGAIPVALGEVRRILVPGGVTVVSVPTARSDVGTDSRDPFGRLFVVRDSAAWEQVYGAAGFDTLRQVATADLFGREGIEWTTFVLQAGG